MKAAWSVLGEDHDRFTKLMDGAGLSIDELLYWDDNGNLPATVNPKQFEQFFRKLTALDYSKVDAATDIMRRACQDRVRHRPSSRMRRCPECVAYTWQRVDAAAHPALPPLTC